MTKEGGIKAHGGPIANHCADHLPEVVSRLVLIGENLHLTDGFVPKRGGCGQQCWRWPVVSCRFDLMPATRRGIIEIEKEKPVLTKIFTWWNGATIGALFDIAKRATLVGEDDQGNRYFEERKASLEGRKRRYVLYKGYAEPSRVPADWHGWLHHTFEQPPTIEPFQVKFWEKPHLPNLTGTVFAYRPKGSLAASGERAKSSSDYESWSPE